MVLFCFTYTVSKQKVFGSPLILNCRCGGEGVSVTNILPTKFRDPDSATATLCFAGFAASVFRIPLTHARSTNQTQWCFLWYLRKGRDSNPRYREVLWFSRPVRSTTLPPFRDGKT